MSRKLSKLLIALIALCALTHECVADEKVQKSCAPNQQKYYVGFKHNNGGFGRIFVCAAPGSERSELGIRSIEIAVAREVTDTIVIVSLFALDK